MMRHLCSVAPNSPVGKISAYCMIHLLCVFLSGVRTPNPASCKNLYRMTARGTGRVPSRSGAARVHGEDMKKQTAFLVLAAFLLWSGSPFAARATRDLVFEDEAPSAEQASGEARSLAVKTTLLLVRDGVTSSVPPSHVFKSGDKVKLVFTTSTDGYVYWLSKGSSGTYALLYPTAHAGMDNHVKRNVEYSVPVKGMFRFDDTPGKEELLCILSPTPLEDLDKAVAENFENAAAAVASLEARHQAQRVARDLVFEEEESESVNTRKQEARDGEPFVAHYELVHE